MVRLGWLRDSNMYLIITGETNMYYMRAGNKYGIFMIYFHQHLPQRIILVLELFIHGLAHLLRRATHKSRTEGSDA